MVDNSWIKQDTDSHDRGNSKLLKTKVIVTLLIIILGAMGTAALNGVGSNATQYQSHGIVIEFAKWSTVWTDIDPDESEDPVEMLSIACVTNSCDAPTFENGTLVKIKTTDKTQIDTDADGSVDKAKEYANDGDHEWGLWYVEHGSYDFVKSDTYDINTSDYTIVAWAYTLIGDAPTVAVDATATSIYGYPNTNTLVTLSPVSTEIAASVHGEESIIGTDVYSDYPSSIEEGRENNYIKGVGTYTNPSYESIMNLSPDMVICDASQSSHVDMSRILRSSDVGAVVIYDGDSIDTVLKNIFIVGTAIKHNLASTYAIVELDDAIKQLSILTEPYIGENVLVTLGNHASPFAAGTNTYISDILETLGSNNVLSRPGWPQITPESIQEMNPSCIIVIDSGTYSADQYDEMLEPLSDEWKATDAWKNGEIYLLCEGLGEMAQRAGPRFAQLAEIIARITVPDAFDDGIVLPEDEGIGDNYSDYLTYTKDLGFNS